MDHLRKVDGIEFGADIVMALQLQALNEVNDMCNNEYEKKEYITEAKSQIPRKIQLVCLKNRNGVSYFEDSFEYNPQFTFFKETDDNENDFCSFNQKNYKQEMEEFRQNFFKRKKITF